VKILFAVAVGFVNCFIPGWLSSGAGGMREVEDQVNDQTAHAGRASD
jgi:hypothetical protein